MVLATRVKEMIMQCERIYQNIDKSKVPVAENLTKIFKRHTTNHYENVSRSLEEVTKELKKINISEANDKDLFVIANAIQELSRSFTICSNKFDDLKQTFKNPKKNMTVNASTETTNDDKPYTEWVREMRTTKNGKKFLDRV